jgi:deazaflavin-dependent oxidoreductase (nitroreductase family)
MKMPNAEALIHRSERWMYAGSHPNRLAAFLNGLWAFVGARGLWPNRLVTLEVAGRRTGRTISLPLIVADHDGERYLVAMLGERASWVANVRAAGGRAILRDGSRRAVLLEEVAPARRAPIIRRHLDVAPAARSFNPIDRHAPVAAFESIAERIPVFRICPLHEDRIARGAVQ